MSAWGANAKSCKSLLDRVEQNDPNLTELFILPTKTFGGPEVKRLAEIFEQGKNTNLKVLSASGHKIPNESLYLLGKAIAIASSKDENRGSISSLAIGDNSMGHTGILAFTKGLTEGGGLTFLEEIDLSWKGLERSSFELILNSFDKESCPRLRKLNLRRNTKIGSHADGTYSLARVSHLEELDLSQCCLPGDFVADLLSFLQSANDGKENPSRDTNLKRLNLQENPLAAQGFKGLLPLLRNSSLEVLNISKCEIGDLPIVSLVSSETGGTDNLLTLDLSYNSITAVGAGPLSLGLKPGAPFSKLVELNLAGNPLGDEGVTLVAKALEESRQINGSKETLKNLDLSNTQCGVEGAKSIISMGNLQSLHLFNNNLGSDGFIALSSSLKGGHGTLTHLDLGGNGANQASVVTLLSALIESSNTSDDDRLKNRLKVLVVGGNESGDAVEQIVSQVQKFHPSLDIARDRKGKRQQT